MFGINEGTAVRISGKFATSLENLIVEDQYGNDQELAKAVKITTMSDLNTIAPFSSWGSYEGIKVSNSTNTGGNSSTATSHVTTVTGGVSGLTRDTKINAGINANFGIYNYGQISISNCSTIGDVIDAINNFNPSAGVSASLNENGQFVLTSTNDNITFDYNGELAINIMSGPDGSDIGRLTGLASYTVSSASTNNVTSTHLTEEQAVKLGYTVIKSAQDLANIANDPDGKYMLMCDIELSSGWKSIADFTGEFNGNGYTISKLDSALFATTSGATISNLSVQGNVSNGAILVDFAADNTVIDHVTGSGTVSGLSLIHI